MLQRPSPLRPDESLLRGQWDDLHGEIKPDAVSLRIDSLVQSQLIRVAADVSGWDVLFRDPADGRLWELTYPHSASHGGGAPQLAVVDSRVAASKYRISTHLTSG
jgi:Immunity protein 27